MIDHLFAVAAAEARSIWRSPRYWTLAAITVSTGFSAYYVLAHQHATASYVSSTAGFVSPRYLVHVFGTVPLGVLLLGAVFLTYDQRHRDVRSRITSVLDAQPVANLVFLAGRFAALLATTVLVLLLTLGAIQVFGSVAQLFDGLIGEPVEPLSLASFVLVNAVPVLAAWCGVVLLLTVTLRNRAIVLLVASVLLACQYWWLNNIPAHMVPALSHLPDFGTFTSDILPKFADPWILLQRLFLLLVAGALLTLATVAYPRPDIEPFSPLRSAVIGAVLAIATAAGFALLAARATGSMALQDRWYAAQQRVADLPRADLRHIEASARIYPGSHLILNAELTLTAPPGQPPRGELAFSFNPGIDIQELLVDGEAVEYRHESGVLLVRPEDRIEAGAEFRMLVTATGKPDPRFAYLDNRVGGLVQSGTDSQLHILGTTPSVFADAYVALMPGTRWLPMPGPNLALAPSLQPRDFFTIDLEMEVPRGWLVAAPGRSKATSNRFHYRPGAPLAEVTVVTAPFERYAVVADGVEVELLLHPRHVTNVEAFADAQGVFLQYLTEFFREARHLGLPYPYGGLSVAEVPAQLRVYGGGYRMGSIQSSPGILLLREHGFPTARFDRMLRSWNAPQIMQYGMVFSYFTRDRTGGNLVAGATDNLLLHLTEPTGNAASALASVLSRLTSTVFRTSRTMFSAYAFTETSLSGTTASNADTLMDRLMALASGNASRVIRTAEWDLDHPALWERATKTKLGDLASGEGPHVALATSALKSNAVARALADVLGRDAIGDLLAGLRRRHLGGAFTLEDLTAVAVDAGVPLDAIVEDWLHGGAAPGFVSSPAEVVQLHDDESGQVRYQINVQIRNDEAVRGIVRLETGTDRDGSPALNRQLTDAVPVPGHSSVEVGWVSAAPPLEVWLLSYFSLNRSDVRLTIVEPTDDAGSHDPPFVGNRSTAWLPPDEGGIIVDDLDPGFSVEPVTVHNRARRLLEAYLAPKDDPTTPDQGLPAYRNVGGVWTILPAGPTLQPQWSRQAFGSAWGKYRRTLVRAASGDGMDRAVFEAVLPKAGRWRLEYHVPEFSIRPRFEYLAQSTQNSGTWRGDPPGTYDLTLAAGGKQVAVEFDARKAVPGWNRVGTFSLDSGVVRCSVSGRRSGRTVVADAIRWHRAQIPSSGRTSPTVRKQPGKPRRNT